MILPSLSDRLPWKTFYWNSISTYVYRTRVIITRSLYIYYPLFEDYFFVFKVFWKILPSWMVDIQEWVMMGRIGYLILSPSLKLNNRVQYTVNILLAN